MIETVRTRASSAPKPQAIANGVPKIRQISIADVKDALKGGIDDFRAMPTHILFLGVVYAVLGIFLVRVTFNYGVLQLIFPLIAGFAIAGPFAAVGLYELSRRHEQGLDTGWWHMFDVIRSPSFGAILLFGLILLATFGIWLAVALKIYDLTFGAAPTSMDQFLTELFTTAHGWGLIIAGNGIGAIFAVAVLVVSVVSLPMLVDRPVGFVTALATSVRAVTANPVPMVVWGLAVLGALLVGSIPFFIGLAIVLPVLGHATWHLYTKVVER